MPPNELADDIKDLKKQIAALTKDVAQLLRLGRGRPPAKSVPVPLCDSNDPQECKCAHGGGQMNDFTCEIFVEKNPDGSLYVSADNPHMFVRRGRKRKLVFEIENGAHQDGWKFRGADPMMLGADDVGDYPDNKTPPREMTYSFRNANRKALVVCFAPLANKPRRALHYQLVLAKDSDPGNVLILDPIVENEGF